jgi:hypothetical protein
MCLIFGRQEGGPWFVNEGLSSNTSLNITMLCTVLAMKFLGDLRASDVIGSSSNEQEAAAQPSSTSTAGLRYLSCHTFSACH